MMRRDIFRLVVFLIPVLAFMFTLDFMITKGLKRTHATDFNEWNAIFNRNIRADMIINGNSRATVHYSPAILDSILHVNSYNIGLTGQMIIIQLCRIQTCLKYCPKPEIIIQDVDKYTLSKETDLHNPVIFLPYLSEPSIREATLKHKGLTWQDYNLPLVRYQGYNNWIRHGLREYFNDDPKPDVKRYKGYSGQEKKWDGKWDQFMKTNPEGIRIAVDRESCQMFEAFIKQCKKEGIRLILVHSPELYESRKYFHNRDSIISVFKQWALRYKLNFLDYSEDTICRQRKYFYNALHLNKEGAELFSGKLARDLRDLKTGHPH